LGLGPRPKRRLADRPEAGSMSFSRPFGHELLEAPQISFWECLVRIPVTPASGGDDHGGPASGPSRSWRRGLLSTRASICRFPKPSSRSIVSSKTTLIPDVTVRSSSPDVAAPSVRPQAQRGWSEQARDPPLPQALHRPPGLPQTSKRSTALDIYRNVPPAGCSTSLTRTSTRFLDAVTVLP
jgi:hypothetical protein